MCVRLGEIEGEGRAGTHGKTQRPSSPRPPYTLASSSLSYPSPDTRMHRTNGLHAPSPTNTPSASSPPNPQSPHTHPHTNTHAHPRPSPLSLTRGVKHGLVHGAVGKRAESGPAGVVVHVGGPVASMWWGVRGGGRVVGGVVEGEGGGGVGGLIVVM